MSGFISDIESDHSKADTDSIEDDFQSAYDSSPGRLVTTSEQNVSGSASNPFQVPSSPRTRSSQSDQSDEDAVTPRRSHESAGERTQSPIEEEGGSLEVPEFIPGETLEKVREKIKNDRERFVNSTIKPFQKPSFDRGNEYHPENLLFNDHRRNMYYAFEYGGAQVLAEYLCEYAEAMVRSGDNFWRYFTEDKDCAVTEFLISTMRPEVVHALICGNLTYLKKTDNNFRTRIDKLTTAQPTPGIYLIQWYHQGFDPDVQSQVGQTPPTRKNDLGKGFSLSDWTDMKKAFRRYLSNDNKFAKDLDNVFPKTIHVDVLADRNGRIYARNTRQRERIEEFCEMIEKVLEKPSRNVNTIIRQELAQFSPVVVGYGGACSRREKHHFENESTSALFGLTNAYVTSRFRKMYKLESYQLLYLCDPNHRNLGEALCSVLASSYHDHLGFNAQRGGAIGRPVGGKFYEQNITFLFGNQLLPKLGSTIPPNHIARAFFRSIQHNSERIERIKKYCDPNKESMQSLRDRQASIHAQVDEEIKLVEALATNIDTVKAVMQMKRIVERAKRHARAREGLGIGSGQTGEQGIVKGGGGC